MQRFPLFPRREFLAASVAALGLSPAASPPPSAPPPSPASSADRLTRRRFGKHHVYLSEVGPDYDLTKPDDVCIMMGRLELKEFGLSLKQATRRAHAFNRQQLESGEPICEWALVISTCREVPA